ncbi:LLM class flavin-dependent oxidoreductase [Streptomyces sp. NPDC058770]|uniref:LLM class flavin-dependent oxidoreductase n=1 Tax=Streptomyces sp. NPDC058770 TaxID=3346631 RepID=UPI0036C6FFA5
MLSLIARAPHPLVRHLPFPAERFEEVIGTGVVAERPGFDAYATGERHAGPFLSSSPSVVLGALAAPTSAIRLPTGVTVVAILDPVRMAEDFATLDPISGGRIERVVGKGAEAGHFSLLGLDEERRWDRRKEKHELPRRLWADESVEREGEFRPALKNTTPCRAPATGPSRPARSGDRPRLPGPAARHGDPLFTANAVQPRAACARLIDHYRERFEAYGHDLRSVTVDGLGPSRPEQDGTPLRFAEESAPVVRREAPTSLRGRRPCPTAGRPVRPSGTM